MCAAVFDYELKLVFLRNLMRMSLFVVFISKSALLRQKSWLIITYVVAAACRHSLRIVVRSRGRSLLPSLCPARRSLLASLCPARRVCDRRQRLRPARVSRSAVAAAPRSVVAVTARSELHCLPDVSIDRTPRLLCPAELCPLRHEAAAPRAAVCPTSDRRSSSVTLSQYGRSSAALSQPDRPGTGAAGHRPPVTPAVEQLIVLN